MASNHGETSKGGLLLALLLGAGIVAAVPQARNWVTRNWASATNPTGAATPAPDLNDPLTQTQRTVEAYVHAKAAPQVTIRILDWTDFSQSAGESAITLHYSVQQAGRPDIVALVRFTLENGNIVSAQLAQPKLASANANAPATAPAPVRVVTLRPVATPPPAPTPPPEVVDRFSSRLMAAMTSDRTMTLRESDAFKLSELDQAKERAKEEKKPLGFVMVWGQFFGRESSALDNSSVSALVHFYEVFHDDLVLVFVRHETELGLVPPAVKQGFMGPDEGGYAPNMAVTDATASEFIVEIPYKNMDQSGRNELFKAGGDKIDQWLATHPDAVATPAPQPAGQ